MGNTETVKKTNKNITETWDINDLARYLGKSPATIKTYISTQRKRLPPCIEGFKRRWAPAIVYAFYEQRPIEQMQSSKGRPRKNC